MPKTSEYPVIVAPEAGLSIIALLMVGNVRIDRSSANGKTSQAASTLVPNSDALLKYRWQAVKFF